MSWIDIGIIALVVLLGLFGVFKGFKKSLLSLGAFLVAFILAFFLANVIAEALLGIDGVKNFVLGNGSFGEEGGFSIANWVYTSSMESETPIVPDSFIYKSYYKPILEIIAKSTADIPPEQGLALYIAFIMFSTVCGVGIFIIARFLLVIVTVIIKAYIGKKKSPVSRLFGFVLGAVRGGLWALAITLVFTCFGGLNFASGIDNIEGEYEHQNAVFCQYVNEGAYGIRNKMFLPNSDAYGRLVNLVFKKESDGEGDNDALTGERLNLYVNISNLNYEDSPYTIDVTTKEIKFDEDNATPRVASEFADVGFDRVMQAILDYNAQAAAIVKDKTKLTDFEELKFEAYNGFVQNNTSSIYKLTNTLINRLHAYQEDYKTGLSLTDPTAIDSWNNTQLRNGYNNICATLADLWAQYDYMPELGTFPDLDEYMPNCVSAGPQNSEAEGGDEDEDSDAGQEADVKALKRKLAQAVYVSTKL